jgi:ABC-type iron transport system FetAB permease component
MQKADKIGVSLSVMCAIHCAVWPLLLTIFPLIGAEAFHNHTFELLLIGSSALIAGYTLIKDYTNHKKSRAIFVAIAGFALIALSHFHYTSQWPLLTDNMVTASGGMIIASSYFWNWRLRKTCKAKA